MTLSNKFRSYLSSIFLNLGFKKKDNYFYKEVNESTIVAGVNFNSKTTKEVLYLTITIALKNKLLLNCQGYENDVNLKHVHISKTIENYDSTKQWLIISQSEMYESIGYIEEKVKDFSGELYSFCENPLKLFEHYFELASHHPIFSNEIIERLLCLSAIYKPSGLNDSLAIAISKSSSKVDEAFINEMIKKFTKTM